MVTLRRPTFGPLWPSIRYLKKKLPALDFITLHWLYFIITCLVSAIIVWGSSTPPRSLRFIDALFLAVSAMTEAGLNTVDLSSLNTFQQIILFLLIMIGSAIFVSAFVVQVRRAAFERKFRSFAEKKGRSRAERLICLPRRTFGSQPQDRPERSARRGLSASTFGKTIGDQEPTRLEETATTDVFHNTCGISMRPKNNVVFLDMHERSESLTESNIMRSVPPMGILDMRARSALADVSLKPCPARACNSDGREDKSGQDYTSGAWMSRNSQFHGLTAQERERLGGYEYRAVCLLAWLVPLYYVMWQLLGAFGCAAWVAYNRPDTPRANGLNPWWVGAFNAVSAFNNSGMSLLDANMTAFQDGYYLLITMGLLILAGNTCYPIFLRLIVWTMWRVSSSIESEKWKERASTLRFLLDHPRRCYTNLFPSAHTWWLLACVIILNGIDWAGFEILNIGNEPIEALPVNVRVIIGLFQAFAVRSGGFYVVNIATLRISLQVLYVIMMYISVYPVVISMRNTNVYEERSLGIYDDSHEMMVLDDEAFRTHAPGWNVAGRSPRKQIDGRFIKQQLRAQLAHDLWILCLALFLIMVIEASQFQRDPVVFSVFNILFDIVSGYGCVGISTGVPWDTHSFCGTWHTLSKLILCFVMLRGRHRGLPIAIDKAVMLPGEDLAEAEEDEGVVRGVWTTASQK